MTASHAPLIPHSRNGRAAFGWAASALAVGLSLTGLAALAMSATRTDDTAAEAVGDRAMPVLLLPSLPAIAARGEPAPTPPTKAPDLPAQEATADQPPDTAPDLPQTDIPPKLPTPDRPVADTALDQPPPQDIAARALLPPPPRPDRLGKPQPDSPPDPVKTAPKPDAPAKRTDRKAAPAPDVTEAATAADTPSASAAASTPAAPSKAAASVGAGKKAVASYGANVMKKIRRTKTRKAPASGTVVVSFVISDSGGLASVAVARSSGSAALDAIAVDHITRAAPFPPPPKGAGRQFAFEFVGKG